MGKYFRALLYLCTGRFSAAAEALQGNKYVMGATFDVAIEKGAGMYNTARDAVAKLVAIEIECADKIKQASDRLIKQEQLKKAALIKGKTIADRLKNEGKSVEDIHKDPDYVEVVTQYKEKERVVIQLEADIKFEEERLQKLRTQIQSKKLSLEQMQRNQRNLKEEKHSAMAEMAIAKELQSVHDAEIGISEDAIDKDLENARQAVKAAKAKAQISEELSGINADAADEDLLRFAESQQVASEFDALIGLHENEVVETLDPAQLPE